jgi:hypothetical protein
MPMHDSLRKSDKPASFKKIDTEVILNRIEKSSVVKKQKKGNDYQPKTASKAQPKVKPKIVTPVVAKVAPKIPITAEPETVAAPEQVRPTL